MGFTVAANDFQRELLFLELLRRFGAESFQKRYRF